MTKEEFEKGYAERSDVTVEWLHKNGMEGVPCDCGEKGCEGWQMVNKKWDLSRIVTGEVWHREGRG